MATTYTVNVLDANGAQSANPNIFVNGILNNGNSFSLAPNQTATVQASSNGLTSSEQSVTAPAQDAPSAVPLGMVLPAVSSGPVTYQVQTQPGAPNLSAALVPTGATQGDVVTGTSAGGGLYTFSAVPGSYNLAIDDPVGNYQSLTQHVTVPSGGGTISTSLVASQDAGNLQGLGTLSTPGANAGVGTVYPEDSVPIPAPMGSEKIYSNSAFQGYFTSAQVNASINGTVLDELNTIQWALQTNTIPIYGYSSRDYDALGSGRSLVQGQLVLNYVTENYLLTLINTQSPRFVTDTSISYAGGTTQSVTNSGADTQSAQDMAQLLQRQQAVKALPTAAQTDQALVGLLSDATNQGISANPALNSPGTMAASLQQRLDAMLASSTPATVQMAKQMSKQSKQDAYANPVYRNATFDLRIEIGTGRAKTYRMLEKCKLISNEVICDQSGQPILEAYGFIARRAR